MESVVKILNSFLFGGMSLFSFGFAISLLKQMPLSEARKIIRATFPMYYVLVIAVSFITALCSIPLDRVLTILLLGVTATTVFARQVLMPKINLATDSGDNKKFKVLHSFSVVIQLIQIVATGYGVIAL